MCWLYIIMMDCTKTSFKSDLLAVHNMDCTKTSFTIRTKNAQSQW